MDKYISDLLELIKAHPELPIVPMVDSEIVCDDGCARWMGAWGPASVTKYLVSEEHIFFFDDEDVEAVLIEVKGYDEFLSMTDKERMDVVERCYSKMKRYRNLVSYYTNKNISVSYLRAKKKNDLDRIMGLYGNMNERYW